mgnify:CR=1 FL=1
MINESGSIINSYANILGASISHTRSSSKVTYEYLASDRMKEVFGRTINDVVSGKKSSRGGSGKGGSYTYSDYKSGNKPDWIKKWTKNQSGGVINRPTIALLGEVGPEKVVPLHGGNTDNSISIGSIIINTDRPGSYYSNRKIYEATSKFLKELTK